MTREDRLTQLGLMGFTTRQADFLLTVMLHSGWCLRRHYATFAGIPPCSGSMKGESETPSPP